MKSLGQRCSLRLMNHFCLHSNYTTHALFPLLKHVRWHKRYHVNLRRNINSINISVIHIGACCEEVCVCVPYEHVLYKVLLYAQVGMYIAWLNCACMTGVLTCVCVSCTHHGRSGCGLVHLVLCCFDLGLQMRGRMEIFAFVSRAATLDVVHTHGDGVLAGVDHGAVSRVSKSAVGLAARAITALVLATHLTHTLRDISL